MQQKPEAERHLAMLIDGDNAQHSLIKEMLEEVSRYGTVTIRRAYGDWVQPNLVNWRPVMLAHAILPIQQWRNTTGKNATDSALIIDAMDILYSNTVHGFCIVSSDSDYTRLCMRIRESGLFVMGMGRQQTPEAFKNACNIFVSVENLVQSPVAKIPAVAKPAVAVKTPVKTKSPAKAKTPTSDKAQDKKTDVTPPAALVNLLHRAFDISTQDDDGWVDLAPLGSTLQRLEPSFDSRTYGFKTLSLLVKSIPEYLDIKESKKAGSSKIHVRLKKT